MALQALEGRVAYVFEESEFDVDRIVGVANIKIQDAAVLARLAMADFEADFASKVQRGDLLIAARNFGYGHPHYPAMKAMRHLGISGVIAESFFPVYWRGEISMGFPQVSCPGILQLARRGDTLRVDWQAGEVQNLTSGKSLPFEPLSQAEREMLEIGGFENWLKAAVAADRAKDVQTA
jgi:3-isopropylmalate/(R)-2-methylmalate dehydratase small subunit